MKKLIFLLLLAGCSERPCYTTADIPDGYDCYSFDRNGCVRSVHQSHVEYDETGQIVGQTCITCEAVPIEEILGSLHE